MGSGQDSCWYFRIMLALAVRYTNTRFSLFDIMLIELLNKDFEEVNEFVTKELSMFTDWWGGAKGEH